MIMFYSDDNVLNINMPLIQSLNFILKVEEAFKEFMQDSDMITSIWRRNLHTDT